jgi:hypothetical protein
MVALYNFVGLRRARKENMSLERETGSLDGKRL